MRYYRRMSNTDTPLPDDIESLKALLLEQQARNAQLLTENLQYKAKVLTLQEQLNLALAKRFAASSEKIAPDQLRLFDEAEVDSAQAVFVTEDASDKLTIASHTRKKPGRQPLSDSLPRVDVIHELDEHERECPHDGRRLTEIGEEISEQLDIIPAKMQVLRHRRKKYACTCGRCIKTAPMPAQPIPKSIASPGLLAHVAVSKYQDALPLYRQETILQRIDVNIPRATLANWMIKSAQLIQPLINLLHDHLLAYDIIQMDETTVQVLNEAGKTAQSKSYLWVQRGGPPAKPVILFDYDPSRSQAVPQRLLEGFKGALQTDGYDGYNAAVIAGKLTHLGCWAHARRKFDEAVRAQGKNKKRGLAHRGLALIQKLYRVEKQARPLKPEARQVYRQQQAGPILDEMRNWLNDTLPQIPPQSATGKASHYLHHEWEKLIRYLDDGRFNIDNNLAENAIRPFVLGRKNWLFSHSVKGVKGSANLYSIIETTKANGLEPYAYLRRILTDLPKAETLEEIETLLPWNIKAEQL